MPYWMNGLCGRNKLTVHRWIKLNQISTLNRTGSFPNRPPLMCTHQCFKADLAFVEPKNFLLLLNQRQIQEYLWQLNHKTKNICIKNVLWETKYEPGSDAATRTLNYKWRLMLPIRPSLQDAFVRRQKWYKGTLQYYRRHRQLRETQNPYFTRSSYISCHNFTLIFDCVYIVVRMFTSGVSSV